MIVSLILIVCDTKKKAEQLNGVKREGVIIFN